MSPEQTRAARALLRWSQHDLAYAASVPRGTVADFESGGRDIYHGALKKIESAFETAGIMFLEDDSSGGLGVILKG
jgi:transcriptional regulator with XRE-family HTH domain